MDTEQVEVTRQDDIHAKGFNMAYGAKVIPDAPAEYNKIKVGVKTLEDAVLTLGDLTDKTKCITKPMVMKALREKDIHALRIISEYFYDTSGIYARFCDYFAKMYRYDWYIIPEILDDGVEEKTIIKDYIKFLHYFYVKLI